MPFTYDITTDVGKLRLLIGDTVSASANFQDEELSAIMNMTVGQVSGPLNFFAGTSISQTETLFLSAASCMDALASRVAAGKNGRTIQLGDYRLTGKDQVSAIQAIAQRFRDAISNIPAWGIVEENSCGFNELTIIRNWVLRTEF